MENTRNGSHEQQILHQDENWAEEEEENRDEEDRTYCPTMKRLCNRNVITKCSAGDSEVAKIYFTDVVIIGNGPSGLALSAFLAGWRPFYDLKNQHPDRHLHEKFAENADVSLIDQNFSWLEERISSEEGSFSRAFPILYDSLARPDMDLGHDHESALRWEKPKDSLTIPHIVLGCGLPGGSWNHFDQEVHTLSQNRWMDLPGLSLAEFIEDQKINRPRNRQEIDWDYESSSRLPCGVVAKYFHSYPRAAGIEPHQFPLSYVTSVTRCYDENNDDEHSWRVIGYHATSGHFEFRAKKLCLATGVGVPRVLEVAGEFECPNILHSTRSLSRRLTNLEEKDLEKPVLIVGGGLTAADSLIQCLLRRLTVAHVYRKGQRETRKTIMGRLSKTIYPEYYAVTSLMSGKASDDTYLPYPASKVIRFVFDNGVPTALVAQQVKGATVEKTVEFSFAVIAIGFQADLSFLSEEIAGNLPKNPDQRPDNRYNTLDVDPFQYRSNKMDNLYAVGPLVGDNYVRYLTGGCFAAAKHIVANT